MSCQNQDPAVFNIQVSIDPLSGKPVCSPDPVTVTAANALLVFKLSADDHEFPASGAVVVTSEDKLDDFPYPCWQLNKHSVALYDTADDTVSYDYTITVIKSSTGQRISIDPQIDNKNVGDCLGER